MINWPALMAVLLVTVGSLAFGFSWFDCCRRKNPQATSSDFPERIGELRRPTPTRRVVLFSTRGYYETLDFNVKCLHFLLLLATRSDKSLMFGSPARSI